MRYKPKIIQKQKFTELTEPPLMEMSVIAFLLSVIAGSMNAYTYYTAELFSTVQSGNIVLLGQTLAQQNWSGFINTLTTVFAFGLGSILASIVENIIEEKNKKNWSTIILAIEALTLIALAYFLSTAFVSTLHTCMVISFIAGLQGNAFHKVNGMPYSNIAVTLVAQLAFSNLTQLFFNKKPSKKITLIFFIVLFGFATGGLLGTLFSIRYQGLSLLLPSTLLLTMAIITYIRGSIEHKIIDPTP